MSYVPFHERIDLEAEDPLTEAEIREDALIKVLNMKGFTHKEAQLAKVDDYRLIDLAKTLAYVESNDMCVVQDLFDVVRAQYDTERSSLRESKTRDQLGLYCDGWRMVASTNDELTIEVFVNTPYVCVGGTTMISEPTYIARFLKGTGKPLLNPHTCVAQPGILANGDDPTLIKAISQILIKILLQEIAALKTKRNRDGTALDALEEVEFIVE